MHHIAEPTVRGMAEEGTPFAGVLYCGLMMTARGPEVLEYNARFGDPETQAILLRLESDLVDVLEACIDGTPGRGAMRWSPGASACVVASSAGYPGSYKTGFPITGLGRGRAGSGGGGVSLGHIAVGQPTGDQRRSRAGGDGGGRVAGAGAGPRLPGDGGDSV